MNSNIVTEMGLELQRVTIEAINAYCRVLELHVKTVEQVGIQAKKAPEPVKLATEGLERELQFLSFLRKGETVTVSGRGFPELP